MTDIDALRKVAEEATPGPWYVPEATTWEATIRVRSRAHRRGWRRVGQVSRGADAAFIAAANPTALLDLLDALAAAEETIHTLGGTYREAVGVPQSEHQKRRLEEMARAVESSLERAVAAEAAVARCRALADEWAQERYMQTSDAGWNQGWDTRRESDAALLTETLDGDA